jgi:hypothetical protein
MPTTPTGEVVGHETEQQSPPSGVEDGLVDCGLPQPTSTGETTAIETENGTGDTPGTEPADTAGGAQAPTP